MDEELLSLKNNALSLILGTNTAADLKEIQIQLLGRNGSLTSAMKNIAKVPDEDKPRMGKLINETKNIIENAIAEKLSNLGSQSSTHRKNLDVTEPGIKPPLGHLHLVTEAVREITSIFERIGFSRVRYPEIEWDWYAFTSHNFPDNHPARDDWETFFIKQKPDP